MNLNNDNEALKYCLNLCTKIISNSISSKLDDYRNHFKEISQTILESFMNHFFSNNHNIMGDTTIRKVKQLKKISDLFFTPIKTFLGTNYKDNFIFMDRVCSVVFESKNFMRCGNLLLLIS